LEFKGNAAVVMTRLAESLLFNERRLPLPSEPPMGIRSSSTSDAKLNVWRSKNANLFQRDDAMVHHFRRYTNDNEGYPFGNKQIIPFTPRHSEHCIGSLGDLQNGGKGREKKIGRPPTKVWKT
jgi:hypothetical protein